MTAAARYQAVGDRTDRYRARLDIHLASLPNDAQRRMFLDNEVAKWRALYMEFTTAVMLGVNEGDATAFDYLITIADIEIRRVKYGPQLVAAE